MRRRIVFALFAPIMLVILSAPLIAGCSRTPDAPDAAMAAAPSLTRVHADRVDLLYRYRSDDGFATATTLAEIPADARGAVQVVDLALSPAERGSVAFVQVFDLRTAREDGTYPGRFVPRAELEAALAEAQATPPQAPVTMYSTTWCGVCRKARDFLGKEGIAFVEKDVEKDPGAAAELAAKARAAGVDASGVPVFDVGGTLMPGFDGPRLLALVRGG